MHGYPGARSVHGFAPAPIAARDSGVIAILWHGEREASAVGHAGAGAFWDDVWALILKNDAFAWEKLESSEGDEKAPEGRGWFDYATTGTTGKIFMFGGLLQSNERSGEMWELEIVVPPKA